MNQQSREKIALVVFVALIVFVIGGGIWYLNVGHNWNTVGTTIDDATGSLEGYTAIVYDGVRPPTRSEATALSAPVSRASVAGDYDSKGASVLELHVLDPDRYREGVVVQAEGKRIGVVSVTTASDSSTYQNKLKELKENQKVDFALCITNDVSLLNSDDMTDAFDIVINTGLAASSTNTKLSDVYCVDAPCAGKIGAVLVSPSDVVSDRVVTASNR